MNPKSRLVAVHVGAGHHSVEKTRCYKDVCKTAAVVGLNCSTAVDSVCSSLVVLEDSPITNAGIGSNLTETGTVECDAGIMNGCNMRSGAVGAVKGIKNPVSVAKLLLQEQQKGIAKCGRIPPSFLVGDSARAWAAKNNMTVVSEDFLVTKDSLRMQKKCYRKVFGEGQKRRYLEEVFVIDNSSSDVSDTVGAICIEADGQVSCGSSSGGLLLKQPGRIGPAALSGCGFWAERIASKDRSVAACTSGCGESMMRTFFAKSCAEAVRDAEIPSVALEQLFQTSVLKSPLFSSASERMFGALVVVYDANSQSGDVLWAHTTQSMCVGIASQSNGVQTKVVKMSRSNGISSSLVVEGMPFYLTCDSNTSADLEAPK